MSRTFPDDRTVAAVISLADRAPSLHNSQPWLWRVGRESVHLYADPARQLREADPDGRELLISCGAALHHARLAFAALGWRAETRRLPNPAEPAHLAAIELHRHDPSATEVMLCAAISARNSDRRRLSPRSVPGHVVEAMERAAAAEGALLAAADSIARRTLSTAAVEAAGHHSASLEYRREIERWTGKHLSSDGVLAVSTPPVASGPNDMPDRRFTAPGLWQSAAADHCSDDEIRGSGDVILTLSTALDDRGAAARGRGDQRRAARRRPARTLDLSAHRSAGDPRDALADPPRGDRPALPPSDHPRRMAARRRLRARLRAAPRRPRGPGPALHRPALRDTPMTAGRRRPE